MIFGKKKLKLRLFQSRTELIVRGQSYPDHMLTTTFAQCGSAPHVFNDNMNN